MSRKKVVVADAELLNREQAAEAIGCSDWQLRKMQQAGELSAVQVNGAYFFHRRDLQLFMRRGIEGARHAQCFERFEQGRSPESVVIELKMPFEEVDHIYQGWLRMADAVAFRPPEGVSRKKWEQAFGIQINARTIRRAFELVAALPDLRTELMKLAQQNDMKKAAP